jgi:two-component system chemotaxis response regulator CheY
MRTVLVVDDNKVSIRLIEVITGRLGYECVHASNAAEALVWLDQASSVEMVITDQQMPGMTGLEFCQKVHEQVRFKNLPIILCTGAPDRAMIQEAMRIGIKHFIIKPITPKVVGEKMAAVESELPHLLERKASVMSRLGITDIEYGSMIRHARVEVARLRTEIEMAFGNEDRVTTLMTAESLRESADRLGAQSALCALEVLEGTRTWRDMEEAVPLLILELGRLDNALDEETRPRLAGY